MYGKGELLLFGRVTKGESVLFLGSIPPRIDRRSGRQVRRIENVNSNRSSWNTVIHRVNAVRKVTQEVVVGGNGRVYQRCIPRASQKEEKFALSLR